MIKLLVIFLSYETKESLTEGKILPYSAMSRKEDAGELICELIMKGTLSPATASLKLRNILNGLVQTSYLNLPQVARNCHLEVKLLKQTHP